MLRLRRSATVRNRKEFRIVTLSRSGYHAIINWLAPQFEGPVCFLNWAVPGTNPFLTSRSLPGERLHVFPFTKEDKYRGKRLLMYSYEDEPLEDVFRNKLFESSHDEFVGRSDERFDIIILRDFFNTMASKLKLLRDSKLEHFAGLFKILWKQYARECLNETSYATQEKVVMKFNQWHKDPNYRKELSLLLGLRFTDLNFNRLSPFLGSSFDGNRFRFCASRMKVLDRWKCFKNDVGYNRILDEEAIALSEAIFGHIEGTH